MSESKKDLKTGCFYLTHDGSKSGHPGMIYWKNDKKNLYLAITTGTSEKGDPHFLELTEPTEKGVSHSYVNKRPFLGKRRDFGSNEKKSMSFHVGDYEILIKVCKNSPRVSKRIKKSDINLVKKSKPKIEK